MSDQPTYAMSLGPSPHMDYLRAKGDEVIPRSDSGTPNIEFTSANIGRTIFIGYDGERTYWADRAGNEIVPTKPTLPMKKRLRRLAQMELF